MTCKNIYAFSYRDIRMSSRQSLTGLCLQLYWKKRVDNLKYSVIQNITITDKVMKRRGCYVSHEGFQPRSGTEK
jgi:hypothetical protein